MANPQAVQLFLKAQQQQSWWMEDACGWGLWDKQREIANALVHHERVAVPASYGVGKTYLAARLALWWLYNHKPAKVITIAPTLRQVKDLLWSELRVAHRRSRRPLAGTPLTLQLQLEEDWYALGFATDPDEVDRFTGWTTCTRSSGAGARASSGICRCSSRTGGCAAGRRRRRRARDKTEVQ